MILNLISNIKNEKMRAWVTLMIIPFAITAIVLAVIYDEFVEFIQDVRYGIQPEVSDLIALAKNIWKERL